MKKISYETYLGVILLAGLLLLFTKGVKRAERRELDSSSFGTAAEQGMEDSSEQAIISQHTVVIDPGHGGSDPGKIGINGAKEKDINLAVSQKLKTCLEEAGIQVILTREDQYGLYEESDSNKKQADMRERCRIIDEAQPDLTVSVHQNSYTSESVCGPQVFYHAQSSEGEKAAACLQEALNRDLNIARPREIKSNNTYYILKKTKTPVVIAECGFLSNYEEAEKLTTADYQKKVAEALCAGILAYLASV